MRKINKSKKIILITLFLLFLLIDILIINNVFFKEKAPKETDTVTESIKPVNKDIKEVKLNWELTIANAENKLPENFEPPLTDIDSYRKFDRRAISYLNDMLNALREDKIENLWVQSAYRSVTEQKNIFENKVQYYSKTGKSREQAVTLTKRIIQEPGCSDHNLGLAIDFNTVEESFETLKGFNWLQENADEYGFTLRYPEDKTEITKVQYEPWHWRYVGKENAKKMKEMKMCLEEYIEWIKTQQT